jgi:hypothetical protein
VRRILSDKLCFGEKNVSWHDHIDVLVIILLGVFSGLGGWRFYGTGYCGGGGDRYPVDPSPDGTILERISSTRLVRMAAPR